MYVSSLLSHLSSLFSRLLSLGWATAAATTEEFSQSIQAPSSTHPGISYPVEANPSLRYSLIMILAVFPVKATILTSSPTSLWTCQKSASNKIGSTPYFQGWPCSWH